MTVPARASAPPLLLPGEHFIAGGAFLLVGALGLLRAALPLAAGTYAAPSVVGVTHLFTLGWLTTSIMGALYQFLPVALGQPIASERAAHVTFVLHVGGVTALVAGFLLANGDLRLGGIAVVTIGIVVFLANLGTTLHRATTRDVTWWAVCLAAVFLGMTMVFGAALGINLSTGFLGVTQPLALGTHAHVAIIGWVLLVMVGVSHRLLPMFLLSHGGRTHYARYAVALLATGVGTLAVFHHVPLLQREVPAFFIAAGLFAFLMQGREFYGRRHRPALDAGLRLAAIALGVLAAALPLGAAVVFGVASLHVTVAYVSVLLLGCTLFVAAHYYKIVPFLVWNRHFGPLAGSRPLPRVADLYSARVARLAVAALATGGIVLAVGIGLGAIAVVRIGAALFTLGVAMQGAQLLAVARRRP